MEHALKHRKILTVLLIMIFTITYTLLLMPQESFGATTDGMKAFNPKEGEYNFGISDNENALGVKDTSAKDKANIVIWTMNNNTAQRFVVKKVKGKWYKIINKFSGKAVSVKSGKKGNGVNIWQYEYTGAKSQQWRFYKIEGKYVIKSRLGYYMTVDGSIKKSGTNVVTKKYTGSNKQKWFMVPRKGECVNIGATKAFRLVPKLDSGKSVAVANGILENKINVRLGKTNTGTAQKIYAKRTTGVGSKDMTYTLKFGHSNKMMEVEGASKAENANVWQYTASGEAAQEWKFVPSGDGYYYVRSKLGKYLTLEDGQTAVKTNIQLNSKKKNSDCQKWKIVKVKLGTNTYINKANKFVKDSRWKPGISWGDNQQPKLNPNADWWGCAAYCFDWVYYMYGHKNGPRANATKYTSADKIKNGDIVHFHRADDSEHWFAVQSRHDTVIRAAEGNCSGKTRFDNKNYRVKDGILYEKGEAVSSIEVYHHGSHETME